MCPKLICMCYLHCVEGFACVDDSPAHPGHDFLFLWPARLTLQVSLVCFTLEPWSSVLSASLPFLLLFSFSKGEYFTSCVLSVFFVFNRILQYGACISASSLTSPGPSFFLICSFLSWKFIAHAYQWAGPRIPPTSFCNPLSHIASMMSMIIIYVPTKMSFWHFRLHAWFMSLLFHIPYFADIANFALDSLYLNF